MADLLIVGASAIGKLNDWNFPLANLTTESPIDEASTTLNQDIIDFYNTPPHYVILIISLNPSELIKDLADADIKQPVVYYNTPGNTNCTIAHPTIDIRCFDNAVGDRDFRKFIRELHRRATTSNA